MISLLISRQRSLKLLMLLFYSIVSASYAGAAPVKYIYNGIKPCSKSRPPCFVVTLKEKAAEPLNLPTNSTQRTMRSEIPSVGNGLPTRPSDDRVVYGCWTPSGITAAPAGGCSPREVSVTIVI